MRVKKRRFCKPRIRRLKVRYNEPSLDSEDGWQAGCGHGKATGNNK